jgi:hypothetical protein
VRISLLVIAAVAACFGFLSEAGASDQRVKDWTISLDTNYQEANTSSDSGGLLGVFCILQSQSCFAYFTSGNPCVESRTVPVLVNANTGAALFQTTCRGMDVKTGKLWVNVFDDMDGIKKIMLEASSLGIAIPLGSGLFKAVRFSLMGSNEAIDAVQTLPRGRQRQVKDTVF